ncbi:MAG TPA: hypothetical protein VMW00_05605 [Dehalococcoidales bacterium]|nr:hypothetical protein [Dehalococcoidales bacterium]
MNKQDIKIAIVDDSQVEKCDAGCGVNWASAEAVTLAGQRIRDRFGDKVKLDYIDLSSPANSHHALELKQRIRDLSLPILVINGEPRISGQFDIRLLLDAIDAEMEMKL